MDTKQGSQEEQGPARGATRIAVDVRNHLAQRRAMGELLQRQKELFVLRESFHEGAMTALIRFRDRYYDVDGDALAKIRAGADPRDIWSAEEVDPAS